MVMLIKVQIKWVLKHFQGINANVSFNETEILPGK